VYASDKTPPILSQTNPTSSGNSRAKHSITRDKTQLFVQQFKFQDKNDKTFLPTAFRLPYTVYCYGPKAPIAKHLPSGTK
jgi:hypothetical protein